MNEPVTTEKPATLRLSFPDWVLNSIYPQFYKVMRVMPLVLCVRYFILLTVLLSAAVSIGKTIRLHELLGVVAEVYAEHFPVINIRDGKMTVDGNEPIVYNHGDFQVKVDTSGQTTQLDPLVTEGIVFDSDHFTLFRKSVPESLRFQYTQFVFGDQTITSELIKSQRAITTAFFGFGFFVFSIFSWGVIKFLHIYIASVFVELIANFFHVTLVRNVRFTLAMTALIPSFVAESFQIVMDMHLPFETPLYVALFGFFIVAGTIRLLDVKIQRET